MTSITFPFEIVKLIISFYDNTVPEDIKMLQKVLMANNRFISCKKRYDFYYYLKERRGKEKEKLSEDVIKQFIDFEMTVHDFSKETVEAYLKHPLVKEYLKERPCLWYELEKKLKGTYVFISMIKFCKENGTYRLVEHNRPYHNFKS